MFVVITMTDATAFGPRRCNVQLPSVTQRAAAEARLAERFGSGGGRDRRTHDTTQLNIPIIYHNIHNGNDGFIPSSSAVWTDQTNKLNQGV